MRVSTLINSRPCLAWALHANVSQEGLSSRANNCGLIIQGHIRVISRKCVSLQWILSTFILNKYFHLLDDTADRINFD